MIQLNLLPDVKLQYIKARQRKRMVISVSAISSAAFLAIFLILFVYVRFAQPNHIDNVNKDIVNATSELKAKADLNKILTIQNQLKSLPGLHDDKTVTSRLFDYLTQLTPKQATISEVELDFKEGSLNIKGNAKDLSTVNKFADTLKFTGFVSNDEDESQRGNCDLGIIEQDSNVAQTDVTQIENQEVICKAFKEVVLKEFSLSEESSGKDIENPISYDITVKFDPKIFANIKVSNNKPAISLKIPKIISYQIIYRKTS